MYQLTLPSSAQDSWSPFGKSAEQIRKESDRMDAWRELEWENGRDTDGRLDEEMWQKARPRGWSKLGAAIGLSVVCGLVLTVSMV